MSEQPEQAPVMTDAEVEAAQLPAEVAPEIQVVAHVCNSVGYCYVCGATNASLTT
jgi:hypothetical protein